MKAGVRIAIAAKLAITVALLAFVLHKVSFSEIRSQLAAADAGYVLASFLTFPLAVVLAAWRWQILASNLLSFSRALKYTWIGVFYSNVLPGAVAGDVAKGISLAARDKDTRVSLLPASIVADRVVGLVTLLLFADVALIVLYFWFGSAFAALRGVALFALCLSAAVIVGTPILMAILNRTGKPEWADGDRPFLRGVSRLSEVFAAYGRGKGLRRLSFALGISVLIHLVSALGLYLAYRSISQESDALVVLVAYPVLTLVPLAPISISGIGLRDLTLVAIFGILGLNAALAVALSWINLAAALPNIGIGAGLQIREIYRR